MEVDFDNVWFQQERAMWHTANITIEFLGDKYRDSNISRNFGIEKSPRRCEVI